MFLRFPVDLTRPPAALDCSSQFPVLQFSVKTRFELCRIAALRANAAAANCSKPVVQKSVVQNLLSVSRLKILLIS
jgi:hypothetical protein